MKKEDIGKIIGVLRMKTGLSQKLLCRGLCSEQMLSKIETGERIPDKLLLDMLLQRLGKSPDKMETIVSEEEYGGFCEREEIETAIIEQNYSKAKKLLNVYKRRHEVDQIHGQYLYKMNATIEKLEHENDEICLELLIKAISYTFPDWKNAQVRDIVLSLEELKLLLMISQEYLSLKEYKNARVLLDFIEKYLKKRMTDEEELVKIYPKYVYLSCLLEEKRGKIERCQKECETGILLLTKNGVFYYLDELLSYQIQILQHNGRKKQAHKLKKQRDSLREVCDEYKINNQRTSYYIFTDNTQREIHLTNELIRGERLSRGLTQEKLSDGIYDSPESISRIENGKETPSRKNFKALMKKLGMDLEKYNAYISAENFDVYEKERKIRILIGKHEYHQAEDLLREVKAIVDMNIPENQQYILANQAILDLRLDNISEEEALNLNEKALSYTADFLKRGIYRVPRIRESFILNQIAIIYCRMKKRKQAIALLRTVLDTYYISKVDIKYHYATVITMMQNLSSWLEEEGKLEEAFTFCEDGIRLSLRCGRADRIAGFIVNRGIILEKIEQTWNGRICEEHLRRGYYLSDLFENYADKKAIDNYYRNNYNSQIRWY